MVAKESRLTVIFAPIALDEIDAIWRRNAHRYNPPHADKYIHYLKTTIDNLADVLAHGKTVGVRSDLRYLLIRRKAKGHGHVAVYSVDGRAVNVLHVFHSAQDWRGRLREEGL
jgi:plasmid stabilization system protein ParE